MHRSAAACVHMFDADDDAFDERDTPIAPPVPVGAISRRSSLLQSLTAAASSSASRAQSGSNSPAADSRPLEDSKGSYFSNSMSNLAFAMSANTDITAVTPNDALFAPYPARTPYKQPKSRASSPTPRKSIVEDRVPREVETTSLRFVPRKPNTDLTALRNVHIEDSFSARPGIRQHRNQADMRDFYANASWQILRYRKGNGGLTNAIPTNDRTYPSFAWIGTLGMPTDSLDERTKKAISDALIKDYQNYPVIVSDSTFDGHYSHYCKQILWPTLHYQIPDNPKSKAYEDHSWIHYYTLNRGIADAVIAAYKPDDIIWIHDYHLFLVPNMVRQALPDAVIGYFLHVSFPSSEVFRCLPTRRTILEGMLGANYIGFQTSEYARHFMQTCNRILAADVANNVVRYLGRASYIGSCAIGINPHRLAMELTKSEVTQWRSVFRQKWEGMKIIASRDKMDNMRGLKQKFLAFERFLLKHPERKRDTVLVQVCMTDRSNSETELDISEIIDRINSSNADISSHQPVVLLNQDIAYEQYLALLLESDSFVVTSLREGMNLTCHEYIFVQSENCGSLILSEFTGTASGPFREEALIVNPWSIEKVAEAFDMAVSMSMDERRKRWKKMYQYITTHTGFDWTKSNLDAISTAWKNSRRVSDIVPPLDMKMVKSQFQLVQAPAYRMFFFDYEGTLTFWGSSKSSFFASPQKVIAALIELTSDPNNVIYLMSGLMAGELERTFRQVPNLGLIAENGCYIRPFASNEWISLIDERKLSWVPTVKKYLDAISERILGSYLVVRKASIAFHIEDAEDPVQVEQWTGECVNHINVFFERENIKAVASDHIIVVEPLDVTKSRAAEFALGRELSRRDNKLPGFLMVVGNAEDDENVFLWADRLGIPQQYVFTATFPRRISQAKASVEGINGALSLLAELAAHH
ncbi:glycosyltransferase family 20 protein [Tortispora caseinolytica NRRL Y-17796]|uniref:Glycosyltransferase family 20 protein n=1 Tax=Tortispora caseinolytica NRRL Y-17796 TaxID=767744 RepID=A0A1E4TCH9_9ASCO|nr:glycosyltransferase family 20 protein [Tortispora caseinolytica NRRL Y-17796]